MQKGCEQTLSSVIDSPWYINELHIALRLSLAVLLGGLIGFEREQSNHAAGLRTHIMVCLGSCLLMLLSIYGFADFVNEYNVRVDPARLAAAVITGIGFLGAGTILHTGKAITGLTTASSIWVVSAIGLGVGAGFYFASALGTFMVLFVLWGMDKIEKRYVNGKRERIVIIVADDRPKLLQPVHELFLRQGVKIRKMAVRDDSASHEPSRLVIEAQVTLPKHVQEVPLLEELRKLDGVHAGSVE